MTSYLNGAWQAPCRPINKNWEVRDQGLQQYVMPACGAGVIVHPCTMFNAFAINPAQLPL